jgi:DNA-binding beta-propeller fold protein YncE
MYEAGASDGVIRVFAPNAMGNTPPAKTIGGPSSGFSSPRGLALDALGNIYLSDCNQNAIFVFAPTATGDATPLRELGGADHRFNCPLIPALF